MTSAQKGEESHREPSGANRLDTSPPPRWPQRLAPAPPHMPAGPTSRRGSRLRNRRVERRGARARARGARLREPAEGAGAARSPPSSHHHIKFIAHLPAFPQEWRGPRIDQGPLRTPAPALIWLPREDIMAGSTKIGMTAGRRARPPRSCPPTGERRVVTLSALRVARTALKARSARPESSSACAPRSGLVHIRVRFPQ
jgi:hypothetical protein